MDYHLGMLIVAGSVVLYTLFGGFLAVAWTDTVQGLMMVAALVFVPLVGIINLGGIGPLLEVINEVDPNTFVLWGATTTVTGVVSSLAWGLGYFGQPHIIVRFMALRTPKDARTGRMIGMSWMFISIIGAVFIAIIGTAFFGQNPDLAITDTSKYESVFLDMARILFHPLIGGLILTAVLAAIMSTISSQLLVSSTSLIEDIFKIVKKKHPSQDVMINLSRTAVIVVSVVAGLLAVNPNNSILDLVGFAWAGFGSAFGPAVLFMLYWKRLNVQGTLAGMIAGAVVCGVWGNTGLKDVVYEMVPGVIAATIITYVVTIMTKPPSEEVVAGFEHAVEREKEFLAKA